MTRDANQITTPFDLLTVGSALALGPDESTKNALG
jgi:hypothetical protein